MEMKKKKVGERKKEVNEASRWKKKSKGMTEGSLKLCSERCAW